MLSSGDKLVGSETSNGTRRGGVGELEVRQLGNEMKRDKLRKRSWRRAYRAAYREGAGTGRAARSKRKCSDG